MNLVVAHLIIFLIWKHTDKKLKHSRKKYKTAKTNLNDARHLNLLKKFWSQKQKSV